MAEMQTDAQGTAHTAPRSLTRRPRVLRVETGWNDAREMTNELFVTLLDYKDCKTMPAAWRALERRARVDFYLAWRARQMVADYDIVWAGSEKVALPLTWMGMPKPLVVTLHFPQARSRAWLLKGMRVAQRWAALGYVSAADRDFFITHLQLPPTRLFPILGVKLDQFVPAPAAVAGPILSLGVTQRDYRTLITALAALPNYATDIYVSSRFGDKFRGEVSKAALPGWVHLRQPLADQELIARYQRACFVVVPLQATAQASAGVSVILEASASGKAVIATRTAGTPSYLRDGETGLLVPPYDVAALRAAIEKLWTQPALAHTLGQNGRRFVEQHFDPQTIARGVHAMLLQVHQQTQSEIAQ